MENKFGIKEKSYQEMLEVFKQIPEIEQVILFGSRARGDYKKTSDIDLAVKFNASDKKLLLIHKLEEINCILKIDVLNIEKISKKELKANIQNEGIEIYSC